MPEFYPKVSIVIPVFNGEKYIKEAIDSALAQTYKNIEIIVVNDGSTDRTKEIALSYGDKIKYFYKENGGQSSALNMGIEKMTGEYFSWLSHDDVYYPQKIQEQIVCLGQMPNKSEAFIYSNYEIIDKYSRHISYLDHKKIPSREFIYRMLVNIPVNGCTVLIHKKLLERAGYFSLDKPHTSDVELFLKLGLWTEPFHYPFILVKSRCHSEQATLKNLKRHTYESSLYGIEALKMVSGEILLKSSGLGSLSDIYKNLAVSWAEKGLPISTKAALIYYKNSTNKYLDYLNLRIICTMKFIFRIIRRKIVKIIRDFSDSYF